ncbi:Bgt-124 [Blumeria graminis f. sp. tritici]|uniref:Bgt-124 n=2 Tax=Blumeria graminis f. sp. tritici TaxID=62690 RepID=A0A9X9QF81_BLUGR|nr:Bgt-124 [Blumeria graminis f. sp. tritici]
MLSADQNLRRRKPKSQTIDFPAGIQDVIADESYQYYWQPYPKNLWERIPWVVDLVTNLKGVGWNWAISSLPPFPPEVLKILGEPIPEESYTGVSSVGVKAFRSRGQLLRSQIPRILVVFLALETIILLMMKDPFFKFGVTTFALPSYLQLLPLSILRLYRQILEFCAITLSLYINSAIPAVVISGIFGPRIFGLSAEPWYWPSFWGSFSNVLERGLDGFWGGFWHQSFRIVFTTPTRYLIKNDYLKPHSSAAMLCSLIVAFCLSALMHWAGCIVFFINTNAVRMALFFIIQPMGILIQKALCATVQPYLNKIPQDIRYAGNFLYVLVWLFLTSNLFIEELVRGGTCLLPAFPISIMQGLGISETGSGWWSWPQLYIRWHTGDKWWTSGLTI